MPRERKDVDRLFDLSDTGEGAEGVAPCGHAGVHVLPGYVQCTVGCDHYGVPVTEPPRRARRKTECLHRNTGLFHKHGRQVRVCFDCREEV